MKKDLKAPLALSIKKEYEKLLVALHKVPAKYHSQKIIEGTGGLVSARDIIAYQIGWGTLLLGWYEAGLEGKMPQMPGDGFTKWDYVGLAQHFYVKYHYDDFATQLKEYESIINKIIQITEHEHETGNLDKLGIWPWCTLPSGKQWPLSKWIQVNTVAPYKKARLKIAGITK